MKDNFNNSAYFNFEEKSGRGGGREGGGLRTLGGVLLSVKIQYIKHNMLKGGRRKDKHYYCSLLPEGTTRKWGGREGGGAD